MHTRRLIAALLALASTAAIAAGSLATSPGSGLADVVSRLEAAYGGEVVAAQLDADGDKPAHYHVDMRYPASGTARLDVDAATMSLDARRVGPMPEGALALATAAALVAAHVPGEVTLAQLDWSDVAPPHYDIDVRLGDGSLARLRVDAVSRRIGWREPAVLRD